MNLYLDSSAWVKLYVAEPDRPPFISVQLAAARYFHEQSGER